MIDIRPWGKFIKFAENEPCTVKLLYIRPNEELSLQSHKHRTERWYFLDDGIVQINRRQTPVKEGDTVVVMPGVLHRIKAEKNRVRVLEVSFGDFKENDEVRVEDKYNRGDK